MKKHYLPLLSIFLVTLGPALGSNPDTPLLAGANNSNLSTASTGFEENKGQVLTNDGDPAPFVRFMLASGNAKIFLLENGIAYQFERMHYPEGYSEMMADMHSSMKEHEHMEAMHAQIQRETFRMDMLLEGADPQTRISTDGRSHDYTNYYNRDVLDVHHYSKITYHDVYPGIDWLIYTTPTGMKYDFVVHPGADPDLIRLRFEHQEELYLDDAGNLIHGNRLGHFTEQRPVSFQGDVEVPSAFILNGNVLRFRLDNYDRTKALTIDPDRIWATFYGDLGGDYGYALATDGNHNIYMSGQTEATTSIASTGHQNSHGGNVDAFLVKFNSSGVRQWATYYGGLNTDFGVSCTVDGDDNVYLAGWTQSDTAISFQGHQNIKGGGMFDAYLVKFNNSGVRQWATYYGGSGTDWGNACTVDGSDNVFLSGYTTSSAAIASGGHQNAQGGEAIFGDAFLVKFNSSGMRLWGTYYGGGSSETGYSCAVDGSGNVYLAGRTGSNAGIADGGHQNELGGSYDAFLVKFNGSGMRQWATYYGGMLFDEGRSCAVDQAGDVYLTGTTSSLTDIASGGHQNILGDSTDGFLVKFTGNGTRVWGTYYGGNGLDEIYSVVANDDVVYLGGSTRSTSEITFEGFQDQYGGGLYDSFLVRMDSSGVRQWATYYGGSGEDKSWGCTMDDNGDVYMTGETGSTLGISYNGHQNTYGGGIREAFLVKFDGNLQTGIFNTAGQADGMVLHLYPNPARNGWFTFTLSDPAFTRPTPVVIELYDALGQRVHSERATASGGELIHVLDFGNDLPTGSYTTRVSFGEFRVQRSVVLE